MKLVVIGLGQCGCRVAGEFALLNRRARGQIGHRIISDIFAINTNPFELRSLSTVKHDHLHRITIGSQIRGNDGDTLCELGAQVVKKGGDKVLEAIRTTKCDVESDAFLLIAGTAGSTGSGAMPVLAKCLKERYFNKPVYALAILPFDHEVAEIKEAIYNTALCLKSSYESADAVILVDNQRYLRENASVQSNLLRINRIIVEPFYNLLCSGEGGKPKNIGARVLNSEDVKETLSGWTAIGYGKSLLPLIRLPFERTQDFRRKSSETLRGIQAIYEAIYGLSIGCIFDSARGALFLISAPTNEISMELIKELSNYLRTVAVNASIIGGDYPVEKGLLDVVVILTQLSEVEKVKQFYTEAASYFRKARENRLAYIAV